MLLFVYGTLRKGFHNHNLLDNAKFIGMGISVDKFYMIGRLNFELDEFEDGRSPPRQLLFPYIFTDNLRVEQLSNHIYGELYEISEELLMSIDEHEGHPNIYKRIEESVRIDSTEYKAMIYVLESAEIKEEIRENTNLFVPILSGDWTRT